MTTTLPEAVLPPQQDQNLGTPWSRGSASSHNPIPLLESTVSLASRGWGYVNAIEPPLGQAPIPTVSASALPRLNLIHSADLKLSDGKVLELGELVFHQHALIGRETCVIRAKIKAPHINDAWSGKSIIVKFSFSSDIRKPEGEILGDIVEIAKGGEKHHEVLHHEAFPPGAMDVQTRLSEYLNKRGIPYEKRSLQVLIMTKLLRITELATTNELAPVIRGIFRCYRWLYEEAKVIHRDVSLNNIMYRRKADNSTIGVLSDYDLSLFLANESLGPASQQRTGTKPYMAIDLLQPFPPKHLYRHDLESLFYVIVVLTTRYHQGQEIKENPPLQAWFDLGAQALMGVKQAFLIGGELEPTSEFAKISSWTSQMRDMFALGYLARSRHVARTRRLSTSAVFDELTLGENVDFEKFAEILDDELI